MLLLYENTFEKKIIRESSAGLLSFKKKNLRIDSSNAPLLLLLPSHFFFFILSSFPFHHRVPLPPCTSTPFTFACPLPLRASPSHPLTYARLHPLLPKPTTSPPFAIA
ncbi:hypothetical protein Fmac_011096 [Flemingia macrophylla]|uniref:Uncharacterized protein n=1 Tax=Flemingia macrophylla TaxID=520843 RepID=A0ABD1MNL4_9FABA